MQTMKTHPPVSCIIKQLKRPICSVSAGKKMVQKYCVGYGNAPPSSYNPMGGYGQNNGGPGGGGYGQGPPPPRQFDSRQPANPSAVPPINKRGGIPGVGGPPGPKRGRYDAGPPTRALPPKAMPPHHGAAAPVPSYSAPPQPMANHGGYSDPNAHAPQMEHQYTHTPAANTGGYGNTAAPQAGYASNGYSQSSYGNTTMASTGYPSTGTEYDTTHYDYRYINH